MSINFKAMISTFFLNQIYTYYHARRLIYVYVFPSTCTCIYIYTLYGDQMYNIITKFRRQFIDVYLITFGYINPDTSINVEVEEFRYVQRS